MPATSVDTPVEARLDLLAALSALEPEFRVVAVACDVVGMSMDEAALALDLPAGTVKSRLHRARGHGSRNRCGRSGGGAVSHNGNDDIAARLRDEASATAPERLRADVMLRVRAEPRPQRIRPARGASGVRS